MQDGIDQAAENTALGKPIDICLAQKKWTRMAPLCSLNTDQQLRIELPSILIGSDVVQGNTF